MHSERPGHRMYEQWHPLGVVGVISAFNFPVAVWAWNAMIAAVCGDCVLWRPSSETPLVAVAVQHIVNRVFDRHGLKGVFNLVIGPSQPVAESLIRDPRIPLVSFTGSTEVGRHVSEVIAQRLGRSILELGGNNGIIAMDDANADLAPWARRDSAAPPRAACSCNAASRPESSKRWSALTGRCASGIRSTSIPSWAR
jgi:aldehyde dehydrogenase (NAD+)